MDEDIVYDHKEKRPEADFYNIYTQKDGTKAYYFRTMLSLLKIELTYGAATGQWSYTTYQADKVVDGVWHPPAE